jgi:predicted metal-binding transcription factor (methanogenesis marker protein 9)
MLPHLITYDYELPDGTVYSFQIDLNRPTQPTASPTTDRAALPPWTRLEFHRCENCSLAATQTCCPAAVDAAPILERFSHVLSTARLKVTVRDASRMFSKETDAQMGLQTLLALVMASSTCPILCRLRSQALFHLPFASVEETLYRTVGDYLIKQYFIMKDGGQPDFALTGLDALYHDLATLNIHFFSRIKAACTKDANLNAVVVLRSLSEIVSMSLDERLVSLREAMQAMG